MLTKYYIPTRTAVFMTAIIIGLLTVIALLGSSFQQHVAHAAQNDSVYASNVSQHKLTYNDYARIHEQRQQVIAAKEKIQQSNQ